MIEFANSQCVMQRLALRLYGAKVKTIQLFRHKKDDKTSTLLIYFIIPPPILTIRESKTGIIVAQFVFNRRFLAMAEYSSELELCSFGLTKTFPYRKLGQKRRQCFVKQIFIPKFATRTPKAHIKSTTE